MNNGFSPSRRAWNRVMTVLVWASAVLVMVLVAGIIGMVLVRGIPHISWNFLSTTASVLKKTDGILPAILNTLYVIVLTLLIVLPLGVGAAVYLTEYASNRRLIEVIEFTNETLAGIPSIIYGLVGMLVFSQALGFQTCLFVRQPDAGGDEPAHHHPHHAGIPQKPCRRATARVPWVWVQASGTSSAPSCCLAALTASSPAAFWRWDASWAKAPRCCSPPVRQR